MAHAFRVAGMPCVGFSQTTWMLSHGVDPYILTIDFPKEWAYKILGEVRQQPVDIYMLSDERDPVIISKLYLLGSAPAREPYMLGLRFADKRWKWRYPHITRRYNIRRPTGNFRQVGDRILGVEQYVPDFAYVPLSLGVSGQPVTAKELFNDIIGLLDGEDPKIDGDLRSIADLPLESIEIDDKGHNALRKALDHLPGLSVFVDYDGKTTVTDLYDPATTERARQQLTDAIVQGGGTVTLIDNERIRPEYIDFLFTREHEVRFDYSDLGTVTRDGRWLRNDCEIPDITLTVGGVEYGHGSYIQFANPLFTAWGAGPGGLPQITEEIIRQSLPWNKLELTYGELGKTLSPDQDWRRRVDAINEHYRQTYRINRRWVDRALAIKDIRVARIDPENGTFQRAQAYMNYAVMPSIRGMLKDPQQAGYMFNIEGYRDNIEEAAPSPAAVHVINEMIGIISVRLAPHTLGWVNQYLPSAVTNIPVYNPAKPDNRIDKKGVLELVSNHKMAVVLTLVPGWPNNKKQFYRVRKRFDDLLPPGYKQYARRSYGPTLEVRVPSQFSARFAWKDEFANDIEAAFGLPLITDRDSPTTTEALEQLLVNRDETDAIVAAMGRAVTMGMIDRPHGEVVVPLKKISPIGNMTQVTHTMDRGGAYTRVAFAGDVPTPNWLAYLPDDIRRKLLRQVGV